MTNLSAIQERVAALEAALEGLSVTLDDRASDYRHMLRGGSYRNTMNSLWFDDKDKAIEMICEDFAEHAKLARAALTIDRGADAFVKVGERWHGKSDVMCYVFKVDAVGKVIEAARIIAKRAEGKIVTPDSQGRFTLVLVSELTTLHDALDALPQSDAPQKEKT